MGFLSDLVAGSPGDVVVKADMKSHKPLETAAIFFSSEPFLKQGIS